MDDPPAVVDFSTVLVETEPVVNGAKEPRSCAGGIVPAESGVISEARKGIEGIMTPAMFVFVGVVMRLMRVMVGMIHAKEVADAIAHGGGALAQWVVAVTMGIGVGVGVGVGLMGMMGVGIVREMMRRVRRVVVGRVRGVAMGRVCALAMVGVIVMARILGSR